MYSKSKLLLHSILFFIFHKIMFKSSFDEKKLFKKFNAIYIIKLDEQWISLAKIILLVLKKAETCEKENVPTFKSFNIAKVAKNVDYIFVNKKN